MRYVRRYFAMNTRQSDGATLRAHLEQAAKRGSVSAKAELAADVSPGPLAYLWDWFLELHNRRGSGGMGPGAITWPDLDAWTRLMGRTVAPWEYDVLGRLDGEFFATVAPASTGGGSN